MAPRTLTDSQVADAVAARRRGEKYTTIAKRYGVTPSAVGARVRAFLKQKRAPIPSPETSDRPSSDDEGSLLDRARAAADGGESGERGSAPPSDNGTAAHLSVTPDMVVATCEAVAANGTRLASFFYRVPAPVVRQLATLDPAERDMLRDNAGLVIPWLNQQEVSPRTGAILFGLMFAGILIGKTLQLREYSAEFARGRSATRPPREDTTASRGTSESPAPENPPSPSSMPASS